MELWEVITVQRVRLYLQAMAKSAYLLGLKVVVVLRVVMEVFGGCLVQRELRCSGSRNAGKQASRTKYLAP